VSNTATLEEGGRRQGIYDADQAGGTQKAPEDYPTECRMELVQILEEPQKDMVPGLTGEAMFVDDANGIHSA